MAMTQEPNLEVPTILFRPIVQAYVREDPHKAWPKIWHIQYQPILIGSWRSPIAYTLAVDVLANAKRLRNLLRLVVELVVRVGLLSACGHAKPS